MPALNALARPEGDAGSLDWAAGPLDGLEPRLRCLRAGLRLEVLTEIDSTNTRLQQRARAGDLAPCLLVARRQTAGRGRLGRFWWSDTTGAGSLTFSIGLCLSPRLPSGWSGLSLAVGVALAESLGESVRLKWPNDLWLQQSPLALGRKLGGVLIETVAAVPAGDDRARYAIVGIGINLDAPSAPAGIGQPVAGWREVEPAATAHTLLGRVAPAVLQALTEFESGGFAAFASRFAARDALAGRAVRTLSVPLLKGVAEGVDALGALRLRTGAPGEAGLCRVESGEDASTAGHAEPSVRPC